MSKLYSLSIVLCLLFSFAASADNGPGGTTLPDGILVLGDDAKVVALNLVVAYKDQSSPGVMRSHGTYRDQPAACDFAIKTYGPPIQCLIGFDPLSPDLGNLRNN